MEDARKPLKSGNLSCKVVDLAVGEARNLILIDAMHSRHWKLQRHRTPSSTIGDGALILIFSLSSSGLAEVSCFGILRYHLLVLM
ncbi:hypothetical protein VNO80_01250 [Phaseolus coccineus]|uniref:Uncharacterized protein n=1 Tax=Phaseolus coccineus TaxID=3886 RepID=A0AAN9RSK0_PHACN